MIWSWQYALAVLPEILGAFVVTLQATLAGFVLAVLLGLAWAVARMAPLRWLARGVFWMVEFVRSTPLLIQLYFLYYVLPEYGLTLSPLVIGVLAL
ncbi:MAG TPA: ABC transporter permease subunit, partial [Woeseiaceae bacterium]|nr:ABC transporter permease subunit [Woeseiaceae bacterium]